MNYPAFPDLKGLVDRIEEYGRLKHEYGAQGLDGLLGEAEAGLGSILARVKGLVVDPDLAAHEPDDLAGIRAARPDGPRRMWASLDRTLYRQKLEGAFLARSAGCLLGAIVEGWSIDQMEAWSRYIGDPFPPVDYWSRAKDPSHRRYCMSANQEYTRGSLDGAPVDDDIAYTILGLLVAEECGPEFTTADVGRVWVERLPYACTAEAVVLAHLQAGMRAEDVAEADNPFCQWIGAAIRSDPWAYMAPALPEKAAGMAYRDACLSHRRNGIYGEMFFAAAQAAAFVVDDPIAALEIGLTEIPRDCALARAIRWALAAGKGLKNYREARQAVDEHFSGMHSVHTINNACLTVFGLMIGGIDVTRVLSETVAMGLDNDCTAATAGSIVGAVVGRDGVPAHWYEKFHNTVRSYLIGGESFRIDDLVDRFARQAEIVWE